MPYVTWQNEFKCQLCFSYSLPPPPAISDGMFLASVYVMCVSVEQLPAIGLIIMMEVKGARKNR